jgi:hypothetical protein
MKPSTHELDGNSSLEPGAECGGLIQLVQQAGTFCRALETTKGKCTRRLTENPEPLQGFLHRSESLAASDQRICGSDGRFEGPLAVSRRQTMNADPFVGGLVASCVCARCTALPEYSVRMWCPFVSGSARAVVVRRSLEWLQSPIERRRRLTNSRCGKRGGMGAQGLQDMRPPRPGLPASSRPATLRDSFPPLMELNQPACAQNVGNGTRESGKHKPHLLRFIDDNAFDEVDCQGIPGFHSLSRRQVYCRESQVDCVSEEDPREGFGDQNLDPGCSQTARSVFSTGSTTEVPARDQYAVL